MNGYEYRYDINKYERISEWIWIGWIGRMRNALFSSIMIIWFAWILGPEHMSESAMQHRYHLHETLQAPGEVKTRQILQERLKRNAVYIMYCHDVVSIEIVLFSLKLQFWSKKMVIFTKRALYLRYVFPWQSVTPRCVGILGIRYLLRQESSTRER